MEVRGFCIWRIIEGIFEKQFQILKKGKLIYNYHGVSVNKLLEKLYNDKAPKWKKYNYYIQQN